MSLTLEQQALVDAEAARFGFVDNGAGTYTWPRYPLWELRAMRCKDLPDDSEQAGFYCGRIDPSWLATHAEATFASQSHLFSGEIPSLEARLYFSRHVGGDSCFVSRTIAACIELQESEWANALA